MARAVIPDFEPHTPDNIPDSRPTCSRPSEDNKGCDVYNVCRLAVKGQNRGPCQLVMEDYRGTEPGSGRRVPIWCFSAYRRYFGARQVAGFRLCADGIHPEQRPDGSWIAAVMPPPEQQGPYPFAPLSNPNLDANDVVARALAGDFTPSAPKVPKPPLDAAEVKRMALAAGLPVNDRGTGYVAPPPDPAPAQPAPMDTPDASATAPAAPATDAPAINDEPLSKLQQRLRRTHGD